MGIELKKHNEEAYDKVKTEFEDSNRVAVVHAMGTGKSFIALKLIEDNQDKKVLYLAPSNAILHQIKKSAIEEEGKMFGNVTRMTYQKLNNLSEEELAKINPDIIVLDEFHHCGAEKWGQTIQELLELNPDVKVLGLSATPIRYFDGNVDMAEELFEGHIASEISFEDAIEGKILPPFIYISAMYGSIENIRYIENGIEQSGVNERRKEEAKRIYNDLYRKVGENIQGLPDVLSRHMQKKDGKYIVFCRNIEDMKQKMQEAKEIFKKVNLNMHIYCVSSADDDIRKNEIELSNFENDSTPNTLKLIFSVNMINEGLHLPDIDGVVMMRPTQSPTIYLQQLGRALSAGNKSGEKPVIIDLVDNFDSIRIIEDFTEKMKKYETSSSETRDNEANEDAVTIYDYLKETRRIVDKIQRFTSTKLSISDKIDLFEEFIQNIGEPIIRNTIYKGYPIGVYLAQMQSELESVDDELIIEDDAKYNQNQIERLRNLGLLEKKQGKLENRISRLESYCKNNPEIWTCRRNPERFFNQIEDEEELQKKMKELEVAKGDYAYIAAREKKGKLEENDIIRLKDARSWWGVWNTNGYTSIIRKIWNRTECTYRN